jgi:uncharacterized protein (TIGR02147 family)
MLCIVRIMQLEGKDYRDLLRKELVRRQNANSQYSLRAFAKALNLNPTTLSLTLQNKRGLSETSLNNVCSALKLDPEESRWFRAMVLSIDGETSLIRLKHTQELDDIISTKGDAESESNLSVSAFRVVADWYHLAILELLLIEEYKAVPGGKCISWISKKLGISNIQINGSLAHLQNLELIEIKNGKPMRTDGILLTGDQIPSSAVRSHHKQYIEKSLIAIEAQLFDECDFSGLIVPTDPKKLPEAKRAIQTFRKKMNKLLEGESPKEVYRLNLSLFRITERSQS